MKKLWEVFHLFVCVVLSRFNAVTSIIYVENGKSMTLNPHIQGNPEDILWTFNGNKVAEHDLTEFLEYGQFMGRSGIETITGNLTVHHMTSQDSGFYMSAIQIDGKLQNSLNEVQVIDAVQEPNVTCILNNNRESKTLFCSVSSQFRTTFEWIGPNSVQQSGQELHISKEEKPDSVFICTVKNEVSQKSTRFALKDCPTDIPQPDENIILPVILPIIGAIIVVIGMAVAIYFICQRRNRDSRISGVKSEDDIQQSLIHMSGLSGTEAQSKFKSEDVNQALRTNHVSKDNEGQNINEDVNESGNNEETERMVNYEFNEDVNQAIKNNYDAQKNEEQDINEDADMSDKTEEAERMDDNEIANDSEQRNDSEDEENKEQEMTDAENISKETDLDETSKALNEKPDPSDQRSESGEDLHNHEDEQQEITEAQDLTGPAQDSTSSE